MTTSLGRAAPVLPVADIARAVAFYRDAFGLEVTFSMEEPPTYAVLKGGAAEVHLSRSTAPSPRDANVMHLIVGDAAAICRRCEAAGGTIVGALRDAPWGMRTFVVQDLDGHRVDVGQPLGED